METQGDGGETQQRGEFHGGTWERSVVQQPQRLAQRALRLSAVNPRGNPYCSSARSLVWAEPICWEAVLGETPFGPLFGISFAPPI